MIKIDQWQFSEGPHMSDVFDEAIRRQSPPNDPARIAAVVASDAITCQCIGYFDPFPLLSLLCRALKTDLIRLPRLHRILSMHWADRPCIPST
jgi:hypothetical protein